MMQGSSRTEWKRYSPAAAAAAALLLAGLLVTSQMSGDRLWIAKRFSGPYMDKLKLHPHGSVGYLSKMATFGAQDAHTASDWGTLATAAGPTAARAAAAALAPAPALSSLAGLTGKLLGSLKAVNDSLPAAVSEIVNGTELVLTRPLGQAKGVVLLFHGCQHSALDWGYASPSCPLCLGLPEEMRVVRAVARMDYAAVAFSSADRQSRCWDAQGLDQSVDVPAVKQVWAVLAAREGWEKLPKYALGVSSGASMVLFLAMRMQLDGIVPQIMSAPPQLLEQKPLDPLSGKSWSYPPTYFMHMELDRVNAERVSADISVLKTKQGAWVTEKVFKARPVSAELFSERIDKVDAATGAAIVAALKGAGLVNATGFLIQDPRQTVARWQKALQPVPGLKAIDGLQPEKSAVSEELNLAWARHELISDNVDEVLEWLDARRRDGSAKLLPAVKPRKERRLLWSGDSCCGGGSD